MSDPANPVPYLGYTALGMRSDYMTEDQRFAATRPDVVFYETEPLEEDLRVAGPIEVDLQVSTSGTDSDFVVKLVDVYPGDFPTPPRTKDDDDDGPPAANAVKMGGYQQLVRGEPFRGKFRNSFEKPEPFVPGQPARIRFSLPDVCHVFRRGHRVMVQVQSSWFPLVDLNPQTFVDIPKATAADFRKATQRVYRSKALASSISLPRRSAAYRRGRAMTRGAPRRRPRVRRERGRRGERSGAAAPRGAEGRAAELVGRPLDQSRSAPDPRRQPRRAHGASAARLRARGRPRAASTGAGSYALRRRARSSPGPRRGSAACASRRRAERRTRPFELLAPLAACGPLPGLLARTT